MSMKKYALTGECNERRRKPTWGWMTWVGWVGMDDMGGLPGAT